MVLVFVGPAIGSAADNCLNWELVGSGSPEGEEGDPPGIRRTAPSSLKPVMCPLGQQILQIYSICWPPLESQMYGGETEAC
jgi:hypothetical protein